MKEPKKMLMYIKYPYTAAIIIVMWVCMIAIIVYEKGNNLELLIGMTSIATIYLSWRGFKSIK